MKQIVSIIALFFFIYGFSSEVPTTHAQTYPDRPIQLVIPVPPV